MEQRRLDSEIVVWGREREEKWERGLCLWWGRRMAF